ncbi:hypothetical protein T3H97_06235 [Paenibacillus sp. LX16]|uniref:hypothetical protein n=1 Tax=Paenibacillus sp. LX16 TaxID=1740264 RepID=UPI002E28D292|nr:hypothetical protein [Paenibacillus sp. LX16]
MPNDEKTLKIGLVMPISPIEDCSAEHWADVKSILTESVQTIEKYKVQVTLVSDADDTGVIQKRIVQNIYNSDVVICDVSCKNANVMFELGMRLAFDKPTIIVKDDITGYSFDTQVIEHLSYPRDLRFTKINDFQIALSRKVVATYEKSLSDPDHSTFLKNFGQFKVAELSETSISSDKLILETLNDMQYQLSSLNYKTSSIMPVGKQSALSYFEPRMTSDRAKKYEEAIRTFLVFNYGADVTLEEIQKHELYTFLIEQIEYGKLDPISIDRLERFVLRFLNGYLNSKTEEQE